MAVGVGCFVPQLQRKSARDIILLETNRCKW